MSRARRNGLLRLAGLVVIVGCLLVVAIKSFSSGGSSGPSKTTRVAGKAPVRLAARTSPMHLPQPLHGATAAAGGGGVLVIGGADRGDVSTDQVLLLDPRSGRVRPDGKLGAPLHDAAAASVGGHTLVFGGGAATSFDTAQQLVPGGVARPIGHLPRGASDLSAVSSAGGVYVLGGFDGTRPLSSVLRTADGRSFTAVGDLPTAIRYTAAVALGARIYAFGGELANGADTDLIQEFDTATRRASIVGHLPGTVAHASALVLDGMIYLAGGRRNGTASDRIVRFDPATGRVRSAGSLPAPVFDAASTTVAGTGYIVGGIGGAGTSVASVMTLTAIR
jgi:hypothetical protein